MTRTIPTCLSAIAVSLPLLLAGAIMPAHAQDVAGKTVCYVTAAGAHPYVTPANEAVRAGSEAAGLSLIELSQEFDVQVGTDQLTTCIGRGVNGIILWPLDPAAYTAGLQRANQAGIPVIVMNSPVNDEGAALIKSFTGPDFYVTGGLSAELLNGALGGEGKIVVISGQAGNGTSIASEAGLKDGLAKLGSKIETLQTVYADFDQQRALVVSRDLITRFGEQINGVVAFDDGMARGFIDAWAESGLASKPVVTGVNGQADAFELIRAGKMTGTILQSPTEDGAVAIATMIAVLKGEKVEPRIGIPLPVITSENIDDHKPAF